MSIELIDELLVDAKDRMQKSVESTRGELATVRTGRASPHLLDRLSVDYYGAQTPLIGAVTSAHPILTDPALDGWRPAPAVIGGVLREECERLKTR